MEGTESSRIEEPDFEFEEIAVACPEWRGLKDRLWIYESLCMLVLQWLAPNGGD